jgi:hypothetical protein
VLTFQFWRCLLRRPAKGEIMVILIIIAVIVYIPLAVIFEVAKKYK